MSERSFLLRFLQRKKSPAATIAVGGMASGCGGRVTDVIHVTGVWWRSGCCRRHGKRMWRVRDGRDTCDGRVVAQRLLYNNHADAFSAAATTGDFDALLSIDGVREVSESDLDESDPYVEILCGGGGFGPSTHYYGIVYSAADHYNTVFGAEFPLEEFKSNGQGYAWESDDTDNRYYAEPLDNHFFISKRIFNKSADKRFFS